jgi:putative nucleotidyltransferase with HDIG domain
MSSPTIAVDQLQIGMYIHLDGGWLSHPFPLSSFRITSAEQLATLRGLGLARVRWNPDKSTHERADAAASGAPASGVTPGSARTGAGEAGTGAGAGPSAAELAASRHREALAAQRDTQVQCERQFGEAAKAWRDAAEAALARPAEAQQAAQTLTQALLAKMTLGNDIGIRLVGSDGDRAAAHALNVGVVSLLLGRTLGLPAEEMMDLGLGALLHDLGKLELPERVRHVEPGASPAEQNAYREHVARGVAVARRMGLAPGVMTVIAQHHEHADASGFPQRLGGDRMTLASRIVALVNRYDNLCNPTGRTPPLTPHEAVSMLFAQGRQRYDAGVLNAFIRMMGVYPAGSLVQLTDDRFAMVIGVNGSRPLKPRVLVHDPKVPRNEALLLNLEETPDVGIRRSLTAGKLPPPALEYLDPRPHVAYYFEPLGQTQGAVLAQAQAA